MGLKAYSQIDISISTDDSKTIISKHIYGHFAEHLGRCIYDGFYVGEKNKTIPNTKGIRNDIVAALKKLNIPNLRWPGGCFADTYHWKDGIGTKEKRPKMVNIWWGGITEDNSFGTHEFLNMCELLGAEPYISGNVGSGTAQELAEWVQYVNFKGVSPMSDLRAKNGRKEPWNVKFWGVGNEAWGCGGNMRPEYYADIYRKYATFMSDWTNSGKLMRIASGANSGDYNWTETLMKNIPEDMLGGLALHHYSIIDWNKKGSASEFDENLYFKTLRSAWRMDSLIVAHSAIMDKYDPEKHIALVVDEWGGWYDVEKGTNPGFLYQQNTMRDAMIAGITLNIFNNHSDRVRMANLAQTINVLQAVILTEKEKMILTPTYHVMEMYKVHQDASRMKVNFTNTDYRLNEQKLPALSVSASMDSTGAMHISAVNIDARKEQVLRVKIDGKKFSQLHGRLLSSKRLQDHNTFEDPDKVKPEVFDGASMKGDNVEFKIPPFSVIVLELK
ncbi:MAG TPA: alpha-L-arabinofuranosidase C-terminal domain-containing protein [Flavitalea sp.]|nr:alpha-L-arabinofuranosidase C-terminal domain-containing protein [Flavitalea sp.]